MGPGSVAPPGDHKDHDRDDEQPAHGRDPEGARSTPALTLSWRPMSIPGIPGSSSVRTARTTAAIRTAATAMPIARKSVVQGKSVSVRLDLGGRRLIKKKKKHNKTTKKK